MISGLEWLLLGVLWPPNVKSFLIDTVMERQQYGTVLTSIFSSSCSKFAEDILKIIEKKQYTSQHEPTKKSGIFLLVISKQTITL